ncbi:hypothetical protein [Klebsiella pneumoniae]|uniref:hypothetical protein n=1 Tax=Klebsiella pneumoniae TaxID=573 RepID=UPI00403FA479
MMSFKVNQSTDKKIAYPALGIWMPSETIEIEVEYTAASLISVSEGKASVKFIVKVIDCLAPGELIHAFEYSGSGNPLAEAENSLMSKLGQS